MPGVDQALMRGLSRCLMRPACGATVRQQYPGWQSPIQTSCVWQGGCPAGADELMLTAREDLKMLALGRVASQARLCNVC